MPFQLNPAKVPIWNSDQQLQLGVQPNSQTLDEVSNAQERLINLLFQGIAEDQLELVGKSVGLSNAEAKGLVDTLRPSLLQSSGSTETASKFDARFAEIIRIGFETDTTPEVVLAKRAATLIELPLLDRTGLLMIRTLTEAGFRRFETTDYQSVLRTDLGELGYPEGALGTSKLTAARSLLSQHGPRIVLEHPAKRRKKSAALMVISAMHRVNPKNYRSLTTDHIAIEYGIASLTVSPVIRPGTTQCLGCRDLWQVEQDPDWASKAIQLAARQDQLDDGAGLLLATSLAAKTICRFVDKGEASSGYQLNLSNRVLNEKNWQLHPNCNCRTSY